MDSAESDMSWRTPSLQAGKLGQQAILLENTHPARSKMLDQWQCEMKSIFSEELLTVGQIC
jgi:hypothetical protein